MERTFRWEQQDGRHDPALERPSVPSSLGYLISAAITRYVYTQLRLSCIFVSHRKDGIQRVSVALCKRYFTTTRSLTTLILVRQRRSSQAYINSSYLHPNACILYICNFRLGGYFKAVPSLSMAHPSHQRMRYARPEAC